MDNQKSDMKSVAPIVASIAFSTLILELLIARFFMFYSGHAGALFAIPFALIGIALGGLTQRLISAERFSSGFLLRRFAESSAISIIALFALGNTLLPPSDDLHQMLYKTLIFGTMFLVPFFLSGFLLSRIFAQYRESIGRLYFIDLVFAALACFCVPILFHFLDAQAIILVFLGVSFLSAAALEIRKAALPIVLFIAIAATTALGICFKEAPDLNNLAMIPHGPQTAIVEVRKRWNEHARVSLIAFQDTVKNKATGYRIIQDDAVSNVYMWAYRPGYSMQPDASKFPESIPFVVGMDTRKILVLFAGCGKDMIIFDAMAGGTAEITGVELNPTVQDFCKQAPELASLRLNEFYAKKNIRFVIAEGRNYLEQNRQEKYDVIYIAASGAPFANLKQASSRKYLETKEAYQQYLDHLEPDGLMLFGHQNGLYRLDTLKELHMEHSDQPFPGSIVIAKSLIGYKPQGFTAAQEQRLQQDARKYPQIYRYVPGSPRNHRGLATRVEGPLDAGNVMTDDRPFAYTIKWSSFKDPSWYGQKMKNGGGLELTPQARVIPVVFILLFVGIAFAIHRQLEKREHRLEKSHVAYFILTGFAYMCLEMGLIGQYDLFLGNPLYAMALITAIFLTANGLGSLWVDWVIRRFSLPTMVIAALVITLATILTAEIFIPRLIGLTLAVKIPIVMVLIMPVGVVLGMFFPFAVSMRKDDLSFNVSSAYGFSVLSSVLGGAYSLAVMMNLGYRSLLIHAAGCYALLLIGILFSRKFLNKSVF